MKSAIAPSMTLAIGIIAAVGATPTAYAATVSVHHGAICQPFTPSEHTTTEYNSNGAQRLATGYGGLVCPLIRRTTNSNGATAYVEIGHTMNAMSSCTLYSYDWDGALLGSASANWTGVGAHTFQLTLGAGKSTYWSNYSVRCTTPGQGTARLRSIELSEL